MFGPVSEGMRLFKNKSKIAVVGYSTNPKRISHKISHFLLNEGNQVTGVNPKYRGLGYDAERIPVKPTLPDLDEAVDIIQVFRKSSALSELAEEILSLPWQPKMVWCQQGVVDVCFQEKLEKVGIKVVMDACPYALRSYL